MIPVIEVAIVACIAVVAPISAHRLIPVGVAFCGTLDESKDCSGTSRFLSFL